MSDKNVCHSYCVFFIYSLFNNAVSELESTVLTNWVKMHNELERMWKEAVVF
jgi:hypothetical protein